MAATATQGSEEMLAHLLAQAPKRVHKTKMLKQALTAGNRPVAEALMQVARVQDRSLLGAAIHGALYDLAYKLATRGAKCTELYNGRPLVLLLVNSSFLPAEARALLDLLLSPPDVHTQSWLSVALNVPHEGELPLCTAVCGDAALYKVTRLLQAGAKPDHSDAAGACHTIKVSYLIAAIGNTPLLLALKESHSENVQQVVDLLLQHGASVNARNVADESPLSVVRIAFVIRVLTCSDTGGGTGERGSHSPTDERGRLAACVSQGRCHHSAHVAGAVRARVAVNAGDPRGVHSAHDPR